MTRLLTFLSLVAIFAVVARGAAPLLNYEERVKRSIEMIERIKKDPDYGQELIEDVKRLLPKTEQVESQGQVILVDNSWLHSLLDSYNSRTGGPHGKRADLDEALGRLQALRADLLRIENGESKTNGSVENPRDSVNHILSGPEFQDKKEDPIARYIRKVREAVFNFVLKLLRAIFEFVFGKKGESGPLFIGLVIFLAVAGLTWAVVMLVRRPRSRKKKKRLNQVILDEEIDPNKTAADLMNDGLAAARGGDFRLGIRRLYIALLYGLSERNLIELDRHATNHEYLGKIASIAPLEPPARYMTEQFDYFWYGRFAASQEDFAEFKARLEQATAAAAAIKPEATAGVKPGTASKR
jgi:hypothetical protein